MSGLFSTIKNNYKKGGIFTKLLYINIAIFLIYIISNFIIVLITGNTKENIALLFINQYVNLPSDINLLINRPWSILSYMFVHTSLLHLLFNLIWLHFGSKIFLQFFNHKQLISTYVLGGITGGIFYILFANISPLFENTSSVLNGASASILAIIISIAVYTPNYSIQFPLIKSFKLKYIAIMLIATDLIVFTNLNAQNIDNLENINRQQLNIGGHIAHLGGALYGYLYILLLKRKIDLSINFYSIINSFSAIFKKRKKIKKQDKRNNNDDAFLKNKAEKNKKINIILEKISRSGYDSLTKEEKEILFKESK